jgi:hypothetical protein
MSWVMTTAAAHPTSFGVRFRTLAARILPSPRATPLATAMVLLLLTAALALRLVFPDNIDDVVAWASTNLHNLARHPVAAMLASAFVVPSGLIPELVLVAAGFTLLERSIGTLRTAIVALSGHVVATLLTEYGARLLVASADDRSDVGVSYAMFAVLAAAALRLTGRARILAVLAVAAGVLIPFAIDPGMTTTGHLLAATIGPLTMTPLLRRSGRVLQS